MLDDLVIRERLQDGFRDGFAAGQVVYFNRTFVDRYAEQENIEVRIFCVALYAGL